MDDQVQALVDSAVSSAAFRRNWARLIQKIYEIDPLLCPIGPNKGLFNGAIPSSGHTILLRLKFAVSGYRNRTNASFSVAGNNGCIMVVRHNFVIHNILY